MGLLWIHMCTESLTGWAGCPGKLVAQRKQGRYWSDGSPGKSDIIVLTKYMLGIVVLSLVILCISFIVVKQLLIVPILIVM